MRVRQRHVITVVMDSRYDITYGQHGCAARIQHLAEHARCDEIDGSGDGTGARLSADEEHGFLWRLNTYWSYEERDGGVYLQIESVSLTRAIPTRSGMGDRAFCGERAAGVAGVHAALGGAMRCGNS